MPLSGEIYSFPALSRRTFAGLPGLLADSLPDRFGNALIDAWLARQGRSPADFNSVERLCYIGTRRHGSARVRPRARTDTPKFRGDRRGGTGRARKRDSHATRRPWRFLRYSSAQESSPAHSEGRHLGRRRAGQGDHRLESGHRRGPFRADRRRRGVFILAPQVRWRGRQPGPGAGRPAGVWADRIRLPQHGTGSRDSHERVPDLAGERPQPLHDQALRPHGHGPEAAHAVAGRHGPLRLQSTRLPVPTSRHCA